MEEGFINEKVINTLIDQAKDSQKAAVLENALFSAIYKTSYGITFHDDTLVATMQSVFPERFAALEAKWAAEEAAAKKEDEQ